MCIVFFLFDYIAKKGNGKSQVVNSFKGDLKANAVSCRGTYIDQTPPARQP